MAKQKLPPKKGKKNDDGLARRNRQEQNERKQAQEPENEL